VSSSPTVTDGRGPRLKPAEGGGDFERARPTLSDLHRRTALTPEMALRIEKAFGPALPSPESPNRTFPSRLAGCSKLRRLISFELIPTVVKQEKKWQSK
jgi:hypothetical protein